MMNIKINTKEKFTVIEVLEHKITANMAAEINNLSKYGAETVPHLILNMGEVKCIDKPVALQIAETQQWFYENNFSFVICELQPEVEKIFEQNELLDIINVTPTESEAWDIVQMEEIERELMNDFE